MAKLCKRMKALNAKVEANKLYTAVEALELIKETAVAKFDESVDVAVQLGIDPPRSRPVSSTSTSSSPPRMRCALSASSARSSARAA